MPSAASPLFPLSSATTSQWREVQVVYRRICVLRTAGKVEEATRLESSLLAPAVAALRVSTALAPAQLEALFAAEEDRVANARLLAEILLPMLTESSAALLQATARAAARPEPSAPVAAFAVAPEEAAVAANGRGAGAPGIADFIDEMLSQERAPRGSRRSA